MNDKFHLAAERAYQERYVQPRQMGTIAITTSTRLEASDLINRRNPDYARCVAILEAEENLHRDPTALRILGLAQGFGGDLSKGVETLAKATDMARVELALIMASRAALLIEARRVDEAIKCAKEAVAICPRGVYLSYLNLGSALIAADQPTEALQMVEDMIRDWPESIRDPDLRDRVLQSDGYWSFLRSNPKYRARLHNYFDAADSNIEVK
jgi:tetratricopeptide (TPR) repeat protein